MIYFLQIAVFFCSIRYRNARKITDPVTAENEIVAMDGIDRKEYPPSYDQSAMDAVDNRNTPTIENGDVLNDSKQRF